MSNKIDSNIAGLSYAEETSLKTLPVTPVWYPLEPNDYADFGGEITTMARRPINAGRQQKKGVVTDLDASGGFSSDLTESNLTRLMQGFFFADARERASTDPLNGQAGSTFAVTTYTGPANTITVGTGKGVLFTVGMILKSSGFANAGNNFNDAVVTVVAADVITVDKTLVTEAFPATGKLEIVGYQFADGEGQINYNAPTGVLTLNKKTGTLPTQLLMNVGEWIFIGGDTAPTKFANNLPGYARVEAVSTTAITLREPTFVPVTEAGVTGKTIRVWLGSFIRNELSPNLIKQRSYNLERTLGNDGSGIQSEYLVGAVANEFKMSIPSADKVTCDLSFQAMNNELRDGATGVKSGTRKSLIEEDAFNTSSDIYQLRLFLTNPTVVTPVSLFGYVTEASLEINNNVSGLKAVGTLGSFDVSVGDFEVKGSIECYFRTIAAVNAVKNNYNVGFNVIAAHNNTGIVYDIPLLSIAGGRVTVEKDKPIMLPVENMGAQNAFGYTLGATYFSYLPAIAMPPVQ